MLQTAAARHASHSFSGSLLRDAGDRRSWWFRHNHDNTLSSKPRHPLYRWDRSQLIGLLRQRALVLGRTPQRRDFPAATSNTPHYRTFTYHFGSWTAALQAARLVALDVEPSDLSSPPEWADAELIRLLREARARLGRLPRQIDFQRATHDRPHYNTFRRRFGGWRAALAAAGIEATDPLSPPQGWRGRAILWAMNPFFEDLAARFQRAAERRGLDIPPAELDATVALELLELARVAAHTQERRFAPLASFMAGVSTERVRTAGGAADSDSVAEMIREVRLEIEREPPI